MDLSRAAMSTDSWLGPLGHQTPLMLARAGTNKYLQEYDGPEEQKQHSEFLVGFYGAHLDGTSAAAGIVSFVNKNILSVSSTELYEPSIFLLRGDKA
jgi:hypothetical protein